MKKQEIIMFRNRYERGYIYMQHMGFTALLLIMTGFWSAQAQVNWQPMNGPYGGNVTQLALSQSGYVFAATETGVFSTADDGSTWMDITTNLPGQQVQGIAVSPNGSVFAGSYANFLYRLDVVGGNWVAKTNGLPTSFTINKIYINSTETIFVTTNNGIYMSADNGESWAPSNNGIAAGEVTDLYIATTGIIYAAHYNDVYYSNDDGAIWNACNPTGATPFSKSAIAVNSAGYIFTGSYDGVQRSVDNGVIWNYVNTGLPTTADVTDLAINSNGDIFAGTTDGIYISTDNGDNWSAINTDLFGRDIRKILINTGNNLFVATNDGVFLSTNTGATWLQRNNGLRNTIITTLYEHVNGNIYAGAMTGLYRSTDNGTYWMEIPQLAGIHVRKIFSKSNGYIFVGTEQNGVYRSPDNGTNWEPANTGLTGLQVRAMTMNSAGELYLVTYDGIYQSINNADTWIQKTAAYLEATDIISDDNNYLYIANYNGIQVSVDYGTTWNPANPTNAFTSAKHLTRRNDGYMFATSLDGVYRSDDDAYTWTPKINGLTTPSTITVYINRKGHVFAGTEGGGVFQSTNLGESWTPINTGFGPNRIAALLMNNEGYFLAGTQARGVYGSRYDNTIYTIAPDALDFGNVRSTTTKTDSVVVTNTGFEDISVGSFAFSGANAAHFTMVTLDFTLAAGASKGIVLTYTPPAATPSSANLEVTIAGDPITIPLAGNGIAPVLQVNTITLPFNNQRVGISKTDSISITNIGTAAMQVNSLQITGTNTSSFIVANESFILQPEVSRTVYINFIPAQAGALSASLNIDSDGGNEVITLTGTGTIPVLSLLSSTVSFGNTRTNTTKSYTDYFIISNDGTDSLNVSSAYFSGTDAEFFALNALPPKTAPGEDGAFSISFSPVRTGSHTATMFIESDGGPGQVTVTGTGVMPVMQVLPGSIDYGQTGITTTAFDTIYVTNTGTDNLTVSSVTISGTNAANFNLSVTTPFIVPVGITTKLVTTFSPQLAGTYYAQVNIESDGGSAEVLLAGTGSQAILQVAPSSLSFGPVIIGSSVTDSLTVTNTGSVYLNVTSISLGGTNPGQFSTNTTVFTLAPGLYRKIPVTFSPTVTGTLSATFIINSNGGNTVVPLSGIGGSPIFLADHAILDFGPVAVGVNSIDNLTISNTGTGELYIYEIILSGDNAAEFTIPDINNDILITPSEPFNLQITFTPQSSGTKSAQVIFYSNAASSPDTVELAGIGGQPVLATDKEAIAFGQVNVGLTKYDTLTVINSGSGTLVFNAPGITGLNRSEFTVVGPLESTYSLPSLGTHDFLISFSPLSTGSKTATLVISANDAVLPHSLPITGSATDISLSVTTTTANYSTAYTLNASLSTTTWTPTTMKLFYRQGGKTNYDSTNMSLNNTTISGVIPAQSVTLRGLEYYIRLSGGATTITYPAMDAAAYPAIIQVYASHYTPPLSLTALKYRMVSVPGILLHPSVLLTFIDDYGTYDNTQWRLLYYDATQTSGYAEYPFSSLHIVNPGKAFWLITRSGKTFDVENITSLPTDENFTYTLQPGWNQIANPFAYSINVQGTQTPNEDLDPPVYWNPSTNDYEYETYLLNPWEGYFVYNRSTYPVNVEMSPKENQGTLARSVTPLMKAAATDYVVQLSAKIPGTDVVDMQNYLGMVDDALEGRDKNDFCEAPPIGDYVLLSIIDDSKRYAGNFKPVSAEGSKWDLTLNTSFATSKKVNITLTQAGTLPDSMNLYIFDKDYATIIPTHNNNFTLDVANDRQTRNLVVIIGTAGYAQNNNGGIPLVPCSFALEQNYPNPFNPETTIRFQLARQEHVKLEVFNTLGHNIRTLVNGVQTTGGHAVVWDGRNNSGIPTAGGVYFYRLTAGEQTLTKKMILIR